mgnify:FL=1
MREKPHIIIFNPDEMRYDTMGHMGNPAAVTPFLDLFAKTEAVSFRNAFCQNPVCVPSRCSFFTGLYPHVHGHRTMSYLLHPDEKNLFSELKETGYHVWMNARNDLFAGQIAGWAESNADEIFYGGDVPAPPGPEREHKELKDRYSHFEGRLKLDGQGLNYSSDDEAVDAAIRRIKEYDERKPLCMFLGLNFPHTPYQAEEPYFSAIDRSSLPKRIKPEECRGKSKILDLIRFYQQMDEYTETDWNELRATYLAMCMKVDTLFERLCNALKAAGIYDDCLIFFFSDHGDFAGDYGLTEKAQSSLEDCLTRVPLLIKPPKENGILSTNKPGTVDPGITDSMAELIDFYATAIDYAGVIPGRTHFGRSLRPIIEDRQKENRSYVCSEGGRLPGELHCDEYHAVGPSGPPVDFVYWPKMKAQSDDNAHAKATMIRDKHYKYISRITGEDEFYDLTIDPGETQNQIGNAEYSQQIMRLQVELMRWYQKTADVVPHELDDRFTYEMLWAKVKNICPKGYEEDVKEKIRGGMKQGVLFQYIREISQ